MAVTRGLSSGPVPLTRPGSLALVAAGLAVLPLAWPGLVELARAWSTPEYSHGPLIPLISLGLLLRELRDRPVAVGAERGAAWPALAAGALALALMLAGARMAIPDFAAYGLILWAGALVLGALGWERGRGHWAPVLHLVFMLPLPQVLEWTTTLHLQTVSAGLGVALARAAGVPVLLDGHVIDLGVWKLQVAEACSGLRYIFPILSFSYLVAILYRGPLWHRAILLAMAAPLAVGLNAARIGVIAVLVDRHGIAQAQGALHLFEGWMVFGLCLALLALTAAGLGRLRGAGAGPVLDLDASGLGEQALRPPSRRAAGPLLALALMAGGAALLASASDRDVPIPERASFAHLPDAIGGGPGRRLPLAPEVARILAATDHHLARYDVPGGPVELFVAWYARQGGGAGLHSPLVCLPAAGWEVSAREVVTLDLGGRRVPANRSLVAKGAERQLVLHWFEQRGRAYAGDWQAKIAGHLDALRTGRSDAALIRLSTPLAPGEDEAAAWARLEGMARAARPAMAAQLPE